MTHHLELRYHFDLFLGDEILKNSSLPKTLTSYKKIILCYDSHLPKNWLMQVKIFLNDPLLYPIVGGEKAKSIQEREALENFLYENQVQKDALLIAFGGGTILDLTGFIAATYCRGIDYCVIPSTLLAAVDVVYGGKNGINLFQKKNWLGSFYFPKIAIVDTYFLRKLPEKLLKEGFAEVWKHALIRDKDFFQFLVKHQKKLLDKKIFDQVIEKSLAIKREIVSLDPLDQKNIRVILNFGHTVGHQLESLSGYKLSHGEAVFWGMILESVISSLLHRLDLKELNKIFQNLSPFFEKKKFLDKVLHCATFFWDKKAKSNGTIDCVILHNIGQAKVQTFTQEEYQALYDQAVHLLKKSFHRGYFTGRDFGGSDRSDFRSKTTKENCFTVD